LFSFCWLELISQFVFRLAEGGVGQATAWLEKRPKISTTNGFSLFGIGLAVFPCVIDSVSTVQDRMSKVSHPCPVALGNVQKIDEPALKTRPEMGLLFRGGLLVMWLGVGIFLTCLIADFQASLAPELPFLSAGKVLSMFFLSSLCVAWCWWLPSRKPFPGEQNRHKTPSLRICIVK
jgi:hypothetical protein